MASRLASRALQFFLSTSLAIKWPFGVIHSVQTTEVDLGYATYRGTYESSLDISNFLGIRYAAPPIGPLRWEAPQKPTEMIGVHDASQQPPRCYQTYDSGAIDPKLSSEDCLFLNVHVPGNSLEGKLPVVVWIHGGGYSYGSAQSYNGDYLVKASKNSVIAVVIQYRLGVFGFLPGSNVKIGGALNAGILDQNFALQWVQEHISTFGGDPTRVTIWGESAGGGSILQHVVAHGGKTEPPLFHGAIASSVFLPPQYLFDDPIPEAIYQEVIDVAGCSSDEDSLACLRSLTSNQMARVNKRVGLTPMFGTIVFSPVVDGTFITERPADTLRKGTVNGEHLLAVANSFEGKMFVSNRDTRSLDTFVTSYFSNFARKDVRKAVDLYSSIEGTVTDQKIAMFGESILICPTYYMLDGYGDRSFKAEFAILPANHGDDIPYYFSDSPPYSNSNFQNAFSQAFMSFVINQDPNVKVDPNTITPPWKPWQKDHTQMVFDKDSNQAPAIQESHVDPQLLARCDFWNEALHRKRD